MVRAVACFNNNQRALARALGVVPRTVHQWYWRQRPVPAKYCVQIEGLTQGKVQRSDLRGDWKDIWPEFCPRPKRKSVRRAVSPESA